MEDLKLLQERLGTLQKLLKNKEEVLKHLAEIESRINHFLSLLPTTNIKQHKPKRTLGHSLNYYIMKVMCPGAHMSPKEVTEAVIQAGYKSSSKTLSKTVQMAMVLMDDVRRIDRGIYCRHAVKDVKEVLTAPLVEDEDLDEDDDDDEG